MRKERVMTGQGRRFAGLAALTAGVGLGVMPCVPVTAGQVATGPQQGGRGGGGAPAAPAQPGGRGQQQQPTRDNTAQSALGTGVIGGAVLTEGTGNPVRRARVNLS